MPFDNLLDRYYSFFHDAHPCVLPKRYLLDRLEKDPLSFEALVLVMRYIGSLFDPSTQSELLEQEMLQALAPTLNHQVLLTGYHVQSLLLYIITLYGCNKIEKAAELMEKSIQIALGLGMQLEEFAVQHGEGDPVLEESWRRTWWQLYIIDSYITGGTRTFPAKTSYVEITALLPCEGDNYESGF
ncbi:predicted protein [Uncinocarpus reesii 1704]|uniref:Xylanolytic transcriptional activator regulatory domain-containing protein n=1 Tax=Uncinocarpus reesii (strain UAMH 1704) TaxID=336963 RepID=C4JG11_UNCRE|nr:uncharacterized protein UREG_01091 [Uncinocarpus reesii 1704]EEP76242.1 predicted protein [Uncinocarpus reesii 1704]